VRGSKAGGYVKLPSIGQRGATDRPSRAGSKKRATRASGNSPPSSEHGRAHVVTHPPTPTSAPRRIVRLGSGLGDGRAARLVVPLRPQQTFANPNSPRTVKPRPRLASGNLPVPRREPIQADTQMAAAASCQPRRASKRERGEHIFSPGITPRLLSRGDAASYCGVSATHFVQHVASKVPPIQLGRRKLWDIRSLNQWLDQQSGLIEPEQPIDHWLERLGNDRARARN